VLIAISGLRSFASRAATDEEDARIKKAVRAVSSLIVFFISGIASSRHGPAPVTRNGRETNGELLLMGFIAVFMIDRFLKKFFSHLGPKVFIVLAFASERFINAAASSKRARYERP